MRRRAAATVACLALLAACSGEPEVLEPDPTPTPTPTSTLTPPPMPEQAKEDGLEGAAAFVRHWIDVYNTSAQSGNADPLRALSPDCKVCLKYADVLETEAAEGRAPDGEPWKAQDFIAEERDGAFRISARVDARLESGPVEYTLGYTVSRSPKLVTELFRYED